MITYLRFRTSISIGAQEIESWSGLQSTTSALYKAITVRDLGDKGVMLEYRAGSAEHDVEVPRENIAQITRAAAPKAKVKA